MKIYLFHPETGVYLGEDYADESLTDRGHVFPPDATALAPPDVEPGFVPVFSPRDRCWEIRPRKRLEIFSWAVTEKEAALE